MEKMSHALERDYYEYSKEYKFSEEIDDALEGDYVSNKPMYTEGTLKCVALFLLIAPDATPEEVLSQARYFNAAHAIT
jgi:hypothetical protein